MKIKSFFLAFLAGALALVSCQEQEELGPAKVTVTPDTITLGAEGGSQTVSLTATRDWVVTTPEWMGVDIQKGEGHSKPVTVALTATSNPGNDRTGNVVFSIGLAKAIVTVNQSGALGPVVYGDGSKANPFTVAGVIGYMEELGADVTSPKKVYVKGIVASVSDDFSTNTYGNGTFTISDDGEATGEQFTAYRVNYLGNKKFASGDTPVKKGDVAILYGNVVNYKGNTPETSQGNAFLFSLNGVDRGGDEGGQGGEGEAKGSGTLEDPFNPAGAAAYAQSLGADVQSDKSVYIKGKISKVGTSYADSGNYGNATFNIVDAEDGTGDFYVFQTYYLGGKKWTAGNPDVAVGDIVIVYGPVVNFRGNTPETVGKGASYVYSHNGKTEGGEQPGPGADPAGTGTEADPFNVAAAIAAVKDLTWTSNDDFQKVGPYYVKGRISRIANNGKYGESGTYGNASFYISDDGAASNEFYCFRVLYLGNEKYTAGTDINVGDDVVVCAELMNYKGNTPETVANSGYLVSLTSNGGGNGGNGGNGGEGGGVTSSETVTVAAGTGGYVQTATVNGTAIDDVLKLGTSSATGSGTITVPGDVSSISFYAISWNNAPSKLVFKLNGNTIGSVEPAANSGLKGNPPYTITVTGDDYYTINLPASGSAFNWAGVTFGKTGEKVIEVSTEGSNTRAALFGIHTDKDPGEGGGNGGDNPPAGDVKVVTIAEFLAAAESDTQKYQLTGTIGGSINATYGNFDLTDDSGTVYVYGLTATEQGYGAKNDKSYETLGLAEGDNITIIGYRGSYNGKDEVLYAYFVKKNDGGNGGENPPAGDAQVVSVADFVAAAESDTQKYQLTGTIGGNINTTYGNFDLTDDTGTVYVYGLTATEQGYGAKNDKSYASLNLAEGDNITIIGYRGSYNDKVEVLYAYFVKKNSSGSGGDTPDTPDEPDTPDTPDNPDEPMELDSDFSSGVPTDNWILRSSAYKHEGVVNGTATVPVLKLGTGSKTGSATLALPSGATVLTFYALSWKGSPSTLVFKVDGKEVKTVNPAANDGLSGSSPYTLSVTASDKYKIKLPAGAISIDVETTGASPRAALFAICTDKDGDSSGAISIADFLAADVSSTQVYTIKGVITNLTNAQYGIFDLQDETGTVHVDGLTSSNLGYGSKNDFSFISLGLKETDNITISGYRSSFNFEPQMSYAYFEGLNALGTGGGGGTGGSSYTLDGTAISAAHTASWSYTSGDKSVTATDGSVWTLHNTYASANQVTVQMNKGKGAYVLTPELPAGKVVKTIAVVLNKKNDGTGEMGDRPMDILSADGSATLLDNVTGATLAAGMEVAAGNSQVRIICDETGGGAVYITSITITF